MNLGTDIGAQHSPRAKEMKPEPLVPTGHPCLVCRVCLFLISPGKYIILRLQLERKNKRDYFFTSLEKSSTEAPWSTRSLCCHRPPASRTLWESLPLPDSGHPLSCPALRPPRPFVCLLQGGLQARRQFGGLGSGPGPPHRWPALGNSSVRSAFQLWPGPCSAEWAVG